MSRPRKPGKRKQVGWDDELWDLRFAELVRYREEHGHTRVPAKWRRNPSLGNWLAHQRGLYRAGTIEPDRAQRLGELGVEWRIPETRVEEHDLYTEQMLKRLAKFRERHGHAGVTPSRDHALHTWIARQRLSRRAGTMRKYRRARLDEAGFPWESVDPKWEEKFVRLGKFKARFGHTRVPREWKEDQALGRWVEYQRVRRRKGLLTADHRRRLKKLGFAWEFAERRVDTHDRYLEQMLARLKAYRKRYGHAGVIASRDRALAVWIGNQRKYLTTGTLKEYRRRQMDAAGFPWEPVSHQWEENFAKLRRFKARYAHSRVPAKWKVDSSLGSWVSNQRRQAQAGKLSTERVRRLEELGFIWVVV